MTDVSKAKLLKTLSGDDVQLIISNRLAKRYKKKMGLAVQFTTVSGEVSDVKKGNKSMMAKVTLTDPDGQVSQMIKKLSQLGYG